MLKYEENNETLEWMLLSSNLRAKNYAISLIDIVDIIEEINFSIMTSIISGFKTLEMLKYILGKENEIITINLETTEIIKTPPNKANILEINGLSFNYWEKLEFDINKTLGEFKKYYETMFNTNLFSIVNGSKTLFGEWCVSVNYDVKLNELVNPNSILILTSSDDDI